MESLAVVLLTHDEEANLPSLLSSLDGFTKRLFVMDSGSNDRTVEIAERAGATVWRHPFDDYASQRNRAQEKLPDDVQWVLHLDADERLTPELREEIKRTMDAPPKGVDGFMLRQRTVFMGRWIKHGGHYPAFHLRLFRKGSGRCEERLYDQHFVVEGHIERLKNDYVDVVASDVETWTARHVRWAGLEAEEIMNPSVGRTRVRPALFGNPIERRRWLREKVLYRPPLFLRAFLHFLYRYFLRLGFLDGKEGLIFHFLQGCWYRFMVDAVVYQRRQAFGNSAQPFRAEKTK
ncbi:MAG: glycosyltransferase family 2 protein [Actinomycetota bacterium]|nr:glycosyltransferase family 2 protein [Actinomycetota bacterium]